MSQLIQLRQRIKAIETIKKISHAMRLISMSMHSRLTQKIPLMQRYQKELTNLLGLIPTNDALSINPLLNPPITNTRTLIIVVGSEKGLVGSFNSGIVHFFEKQVQYVNLSSTDIIVVGKKLGDTLKHRYKIFKIIEDFNYSALTRTASTLFSLITSSDVTYGRVICYSSFPKSFFQQIPYQTQLIPFVPTSSAEQVSDQQEQYIWEQPPQEVLDYLAQEYLRFTIQKLLFESFFGEQAARFQSMDSATRNADKLLDVMKLDYNKLRQAKITKELIEVASGYQE